MAVEILKESVQQWFNGHKSVGLTAVPLTTIGYDLQKGVLIRAPGTGDPTANTTCVWVGRAANVTADSNEQTGGMPIPPGEAVFVPTDDPRKVYLISDDVTQDVAWIGG